MSDHGVRSEADQVIALAEKLGFELDPWQTEVVRHYFGGEPERMATVTDDLVVFLRARYDERAAAAPDVHLSSCDRVTYVEGEPLDLPCDCGYPTLMLREVEAKRAILDHREAVHRVLSDPNVDEAYIMAAGAVDRGVKLMATVYDDHPDYRPEWRP